MEKGIDYPGITVVFFCHDGKGNYLLSKRSKNCRDEHGRWDPGAGSLKIGETIEQTLKREIKEEYCTKVLSSEFLGIREMHRHLKAFKTHWIALDHKVLVKRSQVKNGEPNKFDQIGWFKLSSLPSPMHSQWEIAFRKYKTKLVY